MPTNPLLGYYRLNRDRLRTQMGRVEVPSEAELGRRLDGTVSQATLNRLIYDQVNPSSSAMFALCALLKCRIEDIFDPVFGDVPSARPEPTRSV